MAGMLPARSCSSWPFKQDLQPAFSSGPGTLAGTDQWEEAPPWASGQTIFHPRQERLFLTLCSWIPRLYTRGVWSLCLYDLGIRTDKILQPVLKRELGQHTGQRQGPTVLASNHFGRT